MPYKSELKKIRLPREHDRRVKLTDEDREDIKKLFTRDKLGVREIARMYEGKCSRRLIQLILFPERYEVMKKRQKDEKPWLKSYDRKERARIAREHRSYKYKLLKSKKLI